MRVGFRDIFLVILCAGFLCAQNAKANDDPTPDDPDVQIAPSKGARAEQILFFPLQLPRFLLESFTFPLRATGRAVERKQIIPHIIDFLCTDDREFCVYPVIKAGFGSGFGGGLGMRHKNLFDRGFTLNANHIVYTDLDQSASLSLKRYDLWRVFNRPLGIALRGKWTRESDEQFFGVGNDTDKDNRARYGFDDVRVELALPYRIFKNVRFSPFGALLVLSERSGRSNDDPSVETLFPASDLVGLGQTLQFVDVGAKLEYNTLNASVLPDRGTKAGIAFHHVEGVGQSGYHFNQLDMRVLHVIPLWKPRYALVVHNRWSFQQETGNSGLIPFHYLNTLDVESPLRAFDTGRFRDHGMVVFNAEYRYPVWDFITGTVFGDFGRVFDDIQDFSFENFKYSAGGGFLIAAENLMLFRFQSAYGNEGWNFVFSINKTL